MIKKIKAQYLLTTYIVLIASLTGCANNGTPNSNGKPEPRAMDQMSAQSSNEPLYQESSVSSSNNPIDVKINFNGEAINSKQIYVKGWTNLPAGFIFTVGACRYVISASQKRTCLPTANPKTQDVIVTEGTFEATFSVPPKEQVKKAWNNLPKTSNSFQDKEAIPEDFVTLEVIGNPAKQKGEILKVIGGETGINLEGPLSKTVETANPKIRIVENQAKLKM